MSASVCLNAGLVVSAFSATAFLGAYPLQGAFAVDVFEPEVGVLGFCHGGTRLDEGE